MYLLRKLGIPLAALLVLSILALITVVLLYEQNEILLPSYERPETDPPTSAEPIESEVSVNTNYDKTAIMYNGAIIL